MTPLSLTAALLIGAGLSFSLQAGASTSDLSSAQTVEAAQATYGATKQCLRSGEQIGVCGTSSLLQPCDSAWYDACRSSRGAVDSCENGECDAIICQHNSYLYHACDAAFQSACERNGDTYACCQKAYGVCVSGVCGGSCEGE